MILKNSVLLVTGGASNDYGRATVEKMLREGAHVIICDQPTKDLNIYGDDKAIFLPINVNHEKDIKTLIEVIEDKYGKLDGVVNCIDYQKMLPICDFTGKEPHNLKEFSEIVYENILGPFNIVRFAIPLIAKNIPKKGSGRGIIINMSNAATFEGVKGSSAYSASKAAIIRMTEALHFELQGIRIRCICIIANSIKGSDCREAGSFFENFSRTSKSAEDPKQFAELVKTVIEMPMLYSPITLEKVSDKKS